MDWRRIGRAPYALWPTNLPGVVRRRYDRWQIRRRRAWWKSQSGHAEFIEAALARGVRMRLYFDDELSWLVYGEHFEWKQRHFVRRFLRPGDTFVDVGANIGLFTLLAAERVGPTGRVISFEPCTETFRRLQDNVALNGFTNVTCVPMALSDSNALEQLTISSDGHAAWNSLAAGPDRRLSTEAVSCVTWDAFARTDRSVGHVMLMKIDVEGWETRVLQGARELLQEDEPVLIVEFFDDTARAAGASCRKLYRTLEAFGYSMYAYDALRRKLRLEPPRNDYDDINLIAAKQIDAVTVRLG